MHDTNASMREICQRHLMEEWAKLLNALGHDRRRRAYDDDNDDADDEEISLKRTYGEYEA